MSQHAPAARWILQAPLAIVLGYIASGCGLLLPPPVRTLAAPLPASPEMSALAIKITQAMIFGKPRLPGARIGFLRLAADPTVPSTQADVVWSTHFHEGYYYVFNVPPGTYVAVASDVSSEARWSPPPYMTYTRPQRSIMFFPEDLVSISETVVQAGQVGFLGEFVVGWKYSPMTNDADETCVRYHRLLAPGDGTKGFFEELGDAFSSKEEVGCSCAPLDVAMKDPAARQRFEAAWRDESVSGWTK